jgi:CDP-2,3-bis-(O-geranylgeranyl)-sn-glycerol synthase
VPDGAGTDGAAPISVEAAVLLLTLLLAANGTPVLLKRTLGARLAAPIDGGRRWRDGRPVLGSSKTWRGLLGAVAVTSLVGGLLGVGAVIGCVVALTAHLGDMMSSFTKRRLAIPSSGQALGLDQVPESLFPALLVAPSLGLGAVDVVAVVLLFWAGSLLLSRLLYRLGVRDRPY